MRPPIGAYHEATCTRHDEDALYASPSSGGRGMPPVSKCMVHGCYEKVRTQIIESNLLASSTSKIMALVRRNITSLLCA